MRLLFLTPQLPYPPRQGATLRNFHIIHELSHRHTVDLLTFLAPRPSLSTAHDLADMSRSSHSTGQPAAPGESYETITDDNLLHEICARVQGIPQPVRTNSQRAWQTLASPSPDMALRLNSPSMHAVLRQWLADSSYDVIQFEGIEMAPYLATADSLLKQTGGRTALVFDNHNCEYLLQKRNALNDLRDPKRLIGGLYSTVQWWKLRNYERWACRTATTTLAVSGPDAAALQALVGKRKPIHVIPNGIALDAHTHSQPTSSPASTARTPGQPERATLVFTGKMDYRPNIDAVLWFCEEVLPQIQQIRPNTRFQIVGMNPHPRILPLAKLPNVEITGAVEDVAPYIQGANVFVIPLRVGGGTRFKVLEAMLAGKPIVSTSLGTEGIAVEAEQHLLLADAPRAFAQAVLRLLEDQSNAEGSLSARLGHAARAFVSANYGWQSIVPQLEQIYLETLTRQPTALESS